MRRQGVGVAAAVLLACGSGSNQTRSDAALAREDTTDATTAATDGVIDGHPPPEERGRDADAFDATTLDTGVDVTEPDCAVDAGSLDDAEVQLGRTIVGRSLCLFCHGLNLSGNSTGLRLPPPRGTAYPPNLTPDPATGLGCWTDGQIKNAFLNGIDNRGMPLCPPMPRFGHLGDGGFNAAQAQAVVAYLRSLPPVVHVVPNTPDCLMPEAGVLQDARPWVDAGVNAD